MPTNKRRINITPSEKLYLVVQQLAEEDEVPVSAKVLELLGKAIEMEEVEDEYFSIVADQLGAKSKSSISHEEFWSQVL